MVGSFQGEKGDHDREGLRDDDRRHSWRCRGHVNRMDAAPAEQQEPTEKYSRGVVPETCAVHGFVVVGVGGLSMSKSFKARRACSRYGLSVGLV